MEEMEETDSSDEDQVWFALSLNFLPLSLPVTELIFLDFFFHIVLCSCPCVPPPLPIHVPSLLWAVFPLCPVFVVISVGGQDKGVIEVTVSLGFFSPAVVEVAKG